MSSSGPLAGRLPRTHRRTSVQPQTAERMRRTLRSDPTTQETPVRRPEDRLAATIDQRSGGRPSACDPGRGTTAAVTNVVRRMSSIADWLWTMWRPSSARAWPRGLPTRRIARDEGRGGTEGRRRRSRTAPREAPTDRALTDRADPEQRDDPLAERGVHPRALIGDPGGRRVGADRIHDPTPEVHRRVEDVIHSYPYGWPGSPRPHRRRPAAIARTTTGTATLRGIDRWRTARSSTPERVRSTQAILCRIGLSARRGD